MATTGTRYSADVEHARRPHLRRPLVAAVVTAGALLGAGAVVAGATTGDTTYHACVANTSGAFREVQPNDRCKGSEHKISFNSRGNPGAPGERGPQGAAGVPGPQGETGATGPSDAYTTHPAGRYDGGDITLPDLPAGDYVVDVRADLFTLGTTGPHRVICRLQAGSAPAVTNAVILPSAAPPLDFSEQLYADHLTASLPTTASISFRCDGDGNVAVSAPQLTATRVGHLTTF